MERSTRRKLSNSLVVKWVCVYFKRELLCCRNFLFLFFSETIYRLLAQKQNVRGCGVDWQGRGEEGRERVRSKESLRVLVFQRVLTRLGQTTVSWFSDFPSSFYSCPPGRTFMGRSQVPYPGFGRVSRDLACTTRMTSKPFRLKRPIGAMDP